MGLDVEGIEQLKVMLKRATSLPVACQSELKVVAMELKQLAKDMAPEEFGDLKDAITHREYGAQGPGGRFTKGLRGYEIYINNDHRISEDRKAKPGYEDCERVGDYAWIVHEYMGWGSTPGAPNNSKKGSFMPSDESVAAGNERGVEAGGKFLERAGIEVSERMHSRLGAVVMRHIAALDF